MIFGDTIAGTRKWGWKNGTERKDKQIWRLKYLCRLLAAKPILERFDVGYHSKIWVKNFKPRLLLLLEPNYTNRGQNNWSRVIKWCLFFTQTLVFMKFKIGCQTIFWEMPHQFFRASANFKTTCTVQCTSRLMLCPYAKTKKVQNVLFGLWEHNFDGSLLLRLGSPKNSFGRIVTKK